jgi:hypothetical protein
MIPERARRLADFLYDATVLARERGLSYFEGRVAMLAAAELMAVAPHVTGIGEEKYDALALAIIERAAAARPGMRRRCSRRTSWKPWPAKSCSPRSASRSISPGTQ